MGYQERGFFPAMQDNEDDADRLLRRAVAGVIRNAQDGELPLFAWTLGLPQAALCEVLAYCFPELGALEAMPEQQYDIILRSAPPAHAALTALLLDHRTLTENPLHGHWLAHCIAAAAMGSRHLWEELGVGERNAVSMLMQRYFEPLYRRNTQQLKWKRFLFGELAILSGRHGAEASHAPDCTRCAQFSSCFPPAQQPADTAS